MRRASLLPLALIVSFCAGGRVPSNVSVAGHGALSIRISPNPVVATKIEGSRYDFPFDVALRETGGHPGPRSSVLGPRLPPPENRGPKTEDP